MTFPARSTALLLIDPHNDFLSEGGKLWPQTRAVSARLDLVANLGRLLDAARARGMLVVYVPHRRFERGDYEGWRFLVPAHERDRELRVFARGSWGADFVRALAPRPGEVIASEHWLHSGFANTDLACQLHNRGIDRLVIAGMRGNTCVEATARAAVELGFHVTIVKDACGAFRWEEWTATMEINAPIVVQSILSTSEALARF